MKYSASALRNFILGNDEFIPSHTEYKRILLTGYLCIVAITICLLYIALEIFTGFQNEWPALSCCCILCVVSFVLNRNGYHESAKILLALSINLNVLVVSILEPFEFGLYNFFIVAGLGAFAIFGYERKAKTLVFVFLSLVLFFVSAFTNLNIQRVAVSHQELWINIVFNFCGSMVASLLIVYFLIKINHRAEASLRKNEQQIQSKNQELSKLNTELDRFVYSTSHDLRAPINSIQGLIQLTRMTSDPAEIKKYIDIMQGRLSHLTKFIDDISDYSRNARADLLYRSVDAKEMIVQIFESLKFYPGASKINVTLDIPGKLTLETDPVRLQLILSNLISNAFKYYDARKENPYITISSSRSDTHVKFQIEDNGVGIGTDYQSRIFEMFFQASEKSEGSGLGLYIVKEAIEKLDGHIDVISEPGSGSRFSVYLPIEN